MRFSKKKKKHVSNLFTCVYVLLNFFLCKEWYLLECLAIIYFSKHFKLQFLGISFYNYMKKMKTWSKYFEWFFLSLWINLKKLHNKTGFRLVSRQQQDRFRNKLFSHLFAVVFATFLPTFLGLLFDLLFWVRSTKDALFWVCSTKVWCHF